MVEDARQVKIVEKVAVLGHIIGIVLGHEFELRKEFFSSHDLDFALELTDDIFELVVDDESSVAFLGVLDDLIADGGSWIEEEVPVGKLMGTSMLVTAWARMSAMGLLRATDPLSPTAKIL